MASVYRIDRPVWRSFRPEFFDRAVAHVRAGGFSFLLGSEPEPRRPLGAARGRRDGAARMLLPREAGGGLTEAALWALLALDVRRWGVYRTGPARGLAVVKVHPADLDILYEWCERDSVHHRPTHRIKLDCLACAACCRDNHVVLDSADRALWKRKGRPDLDSKAYLRTSKGIALLRLQPDGTCVHLGKDHFCAIYPLRPSNCRLFPAGTEACLAARLDTLGLVD